MISTTQPTEQGGIEFIIVKVQVPLFCSEPNDLARALVYPEDRSWQRLMAIDEGLRAKMKGEPKKFFKAFLDEDGKGISLGPEVPDPGW